ncbi:glycerophosphodiester phosphodiesterase [Caulobacter sp. 73W]|uniref:glycerophosphodiester phosphodiesterase n=1 Tax=Caulobacter sp. 73W TaxID=3161137 RepID=A0AB39KWS9_9CAUL
MRVLIALLAFSALAVVAATPVVAAEPIVIAHRGASGYRPEHTKAAYELAIEQGADFIEPDLVMTKDGVLVARHENEIGRTTDVADHPEFAARRTDRVIEGEAFKDGWFAEDFTLAELKTLRARERRPDLRRESATFDGREAILTLQEIIDIAKAGGQRRGRPVGLYIELKNPEHHRGRDLRMEPALIEVLKANGLNSREAPVFIQSFFPGALMRLRAATPVRLMFLINSAPPPTEILAANGIRAWSEVYSPAGLRRIASFADAVGPETRLVLPRDAQDRTTAPTSFVTDAHAAGLLVHLWSVNADNTELPADYRRGGAGELGDAAGLARRLFDLGVDGLFSDHPDLALRGR